MESAVFSQWHGVHVQVHDLSISNIQLDNPIFTMGAERRGTLLNSFLHLSLSHLSVIYDDPRCAFVKYKGTKGSRVFFLTLSFPSSSSDAFGLVRDESYKTS